MHRGTVHIALWLTSKLMALLHLPMWLYFRLKPRRCCPPVHDDVFFLPAVRLAEDIRQQRLSSVHVVGKYIQRAKEVDLVLNAIVEERFQLALDEAEHADDFVRTGGLSVEELRQKYPLLGVPLTVKESLAVAGMSWSAGSCLIQKRATVDNASVKWLKAAGAIVYAVTNTPELCMNWETFNYATGRTLNPYDTRRTCGGSSGGEAALIASCGSLIGIGSDLVGSGRLPPNYCGVYGHRTTGGLTSSENSIPSWDVNELSLCPITRFAVDLPLVFRCMIPQETVEELKLLQEVEPTAIRVYYQFSSGSNFPTSSVNPEITKAMKSVIQHLDDNGIYTKQANIKLLQSQFDIAFLALISKPGIYDKLVQPDFSLCWEMLRALCCACRVIFNLMLFKILYFLYRMIITDDALDRNAKLLDALKQEVEELLGEDGVLLYPAVPDVAHIHGNIYSRILDTCYMAIVNVLNLASTVIPIGRDKNGLPIGMQVIARGRNERVCFAFARFMETSFGGWSPPKYLNNE